MLSLVQLCGKHVEGQSLTVIRTYWGSCRCMSGRRPLHYQAEGAHYKVLPSPPRQLVVPTRPSDALFYIHLRPASKLFPS